MKSLTLMRAIRVGVSSLLMHKLRSALTSSGVLLGTAAVIAMLGITKGGSVDALEQIKLLGSQNVILRSVKPPESPAGNQTSRVIEYGLTEMDLARVQETFPATSGVVPVRQLKKEVRRLDKVLTPRILATRPNYIDVTGRVVYEGRFLSGEDERRQNNICVLGTEVARALFPFQSPLGEAVKIGGEYFKVVGTLLPRARGADDPAQPSADVTGEVFIPLETAKRWYGVMQVIRRAGSTDMEEVELHEIIVTVDEPENVLTVANAAREMLDRNHLKQDYEIVVPLELLARQEATNLIWNLVLGSIAGISLLVGGIGIMNVMLATVTERTREIGIRRALGAKRRHIVTQFLVECAVLSIGGGLLGIAVGVGVAKGFGQIFDLRTLITPLAPPLAFGISVSVGIIFGLYPAWRAAKMDPVEALRHE